MRKKIVRFIYYLKAQLARALIKSKLDANNAIIITSSPRSGSTWFMEAIQSSGVYACFWEPLHKDRGVFNKKFHFGWNPSLRSDLDLVALKAQFDELFSGQLFNEWICHKMKLSNVVKSQTVLVKFVRANMLLPWLVKEFNFQKKPIHLIRHPIPTCLSQIKNFKHDKSRLNEQSSKKHKHLEIVQKYSAPFEQYMIKWCIENADLLNHNKDGKWITAYYELLLSNPEVEFKAICQQTGIPWNDGILEKINQPSGSDFKQTFQKDLGTQLSSWRGKISKDEMNSSEKILTYFGISQYSVHSDLPILKS